MNIFITSECLVECAQALDDLRLNKMILETAQLLSGAAQILFGYTQKELPNLYKLTHKNHPCAIWARKNKTNFVWLTEHFKALADEKVYRTGVKHLSFTKLYPIFADICVEHCITDLAMQSPVFDFNCTDFKFLPVHEAYKKQMLVKWHNDLFEAHRKPTWRNRGCPSWAVLTPEQDLQPNKKFQPNNLLASEKLSEDDIILERKAEKAFREYINDKN